MHVRETVPNKKQKENRQTVDKEGKKNHEHLRKQNVSTKQYIAHSP